MEFDRLKKLRFDPNCGSRWAIAYTGWPTIYVKTEITLRGNMLMATRVLLGFVRAQEVEDMRKA